MYYLLTVIAQDTTVPTATTVAEDDDGSAWAGLASFLPIILIGVAMYYLLIRPQRRRMRDQQALMSKLEEGDEIITNGGIYGFITAIDGDVLWVEIDHENHTEIRIHRSAVSRKINPATEPAGGAPAAETEEADSDSDADSDTKK